MNSKKANECRDGIHIAQRILFWDHLITVIIAS